MTTILLILATAVALLLAYAAVRPAQFSLARSTTIAAPTAHAASTSAISTRESGDVSITSPLCALARQCNGDEPARPQPRVKTERSGRFQPISSGNDRA